VANHKSAAKRARQTLTRTSRNRVVTSETRTAVKKIRAAIEAKDKETATGLLGKVQRHFAIMAKNGIIKVNTAGRRTSRLTNQINSL
jgi:small subunit ribosomal protein S20